eukprot:2438589-Karenia_brevis.AAC.1
MCTQLASGKARSVRRICLDSACLFTSPLTSLGMALLEPDITSILVATIGLLLVLSILAEALCSESVDFHP